MASSPLGFPLTRCLGLHPRPCKRHSESVPPVSQGLLLPLGPWASIATWGAAATTESSKGFPLFSLRLSRQPAAQSRSGARCPSLVPVPVLVGLALLSWGCLLISICQYSLCGTLYSVYRFCFTSMFPRWAKVFTDTDSVKAAGVAVLVLNMLAHPPTSCVLFTDPHQGYDTA